MFASSVKVSEDTMRKNQLSKRQQGKLRYKKLQELDQSGEIGLATTRNELAEMIGFGKGSKTGISWINNMVNRGYVSEHLVGFEDGKMRKEFHLTSKAPDYDFKRAKAVHKRMKAEQKAKEIAVAEEIAKRESETSLVITKGDMTIKAVLDSNDIVRVIAGLFNK